MAARGLCRGHDGVARGRLRWVCGEAWPGSTVRTQRRTTGARTGARARPWKHGGGRSHGGGATTATRVGKKGGVEAVLIREPMAGSGRPEKEQAGQISPATNGGRGR